MPPFNHHLSTTLLKDTDEIETIDAAFVVAMYATVEFIQFLMTYAVLVSHTKGDVLSNIKADKGVKSILRGYVSVSDVSFALTMYVNNKDYWAWYHRDDNRKKGNKALAQRRIALAARQARTEATQSRTRSGATSTEGEAEAEDEVIPQDEPVEKKVNKFWHMGNRNKNLKFGLGPEARALYLALKKAFRTADKAAWDDPWEVWWRAHKDDEAAKAKPTARVEVEQPLAELGQLVSWSDDEECEGIPMAGV